MKNVEMEGSNSRLLMIEKSPETITSEAMGTSIIFRNTAKGASMPKYRMLSGALDNVAEKLIQKVPMTNSHNLLKNLCAVD